MKMKIRTVLLLMLAFFLLAGTVTMLIYSQYIVQDRWEIGAEAIIDNRSGFQHSPTKMLFGNFKPGMDGRRFLMINHSAEHDLDVRVSLTGPLSQFTSVEPHRFVLKSGQNEKVGIRLHVPEDVVLGNYTGTIHVLFLKDII